MSTVYITHPSFVKHLTPEGHPERPDRMRAVNMALENEKFHFMPREEAQMGRREDILRCHPHALVDMLETLSPAEGLVSIDGDTAMSPGTFDAAMYAIGASTQAVDEVMQGLVNNAFCGIRPPGHHAEKDRAMGFCFFNNAAVAARYAQAKYDAERVAVIDFDLHHGNGTQDIFWADPSLMYCSTHQMPLYPGTGEWNDTGKDDEGNIVNAPLGEGDGSDHIRDAFNSRILPSLYNFNPDLVIISAGFDAHIRDPLGDLTCTEADFSWMTGKLMDVADKCCENRVVSLLEGGYDLTALARSVAVHVDRLMHG
ncbi:histone deacetylase family protein [Cohaesibacter celericrescens]|uniref:Acetoin utilization protein n=1 Tax=Cohaesibacter celericrescens TaxID=2067669 RepID=A0A2N5XV99_9HYPH|nr:histone deacetylase family protein [Cohaesibacter celericrescens]PLW78409.1 acetoin utilization protein [Cohaesibacter celericrescens]